MNGAHDCGGAMGYGPVVREVNEPVFHHDWEARVFALAVALGMHGGWNIDEDRSACENRPPAEYLGLSYYEIWLAALEKLRLEKAMTGPAVHPPLRAGEVTGMLTAPVGYGRPATAPQGFALGDSVRARNLHPGGHTRLPRYLRGRAGEVVRVHGAHVFPDCNAKGEGENPQWLYTVRFAAGEVWGEASRDSVHADLWEPYLEAL